MKSVVTNSVRFDRTLGSSEASCNSKSPSCAAAPAHAGPGIPGERRVGLGVGLRFSSGELGVGLVPRGPSRRHKQGAVAG